MPHRPVPLTTQPDEKTAAWSRRPAAPGIRPGAPAAGHPLFRLQSSAGNRAVTSLVQRYVATAVIVPPVATRKDGVQSVTIAVGSANAWSRGTNPQAGEPSRINSVGHPIRGRYVGGHMFNQTYGGQGRWFNMIVQSENSNKAMNLHDNLLKRIGARASQLENYGKTNYEYWAEEVIQVNPPQPGAWHYSGERYVPASLDVTITPYRRRGGVDYPWPKNEKGGALGDRGHLENIANPYHVVNVPPYPPRALATGARPKPGVSKESLRRKAKRKRDQLRGKKASKLTAKQLRLIPGIGSKKAQAIFNYFQNNNVALGTLVGASLTGHGFNQQDVARLIHSQLK